MDKNKFKILARTFIVLAMIVYVIMFISNYIQRMNIPMDSFYNSNESDSLKIISSFENKDFEINLKQFAKENNISLEIEYAGTLEIMESLNAGKQYDAVWISNSIWLYMLDDSIKVSEAKSTSTNPVIFAIKQSKAEELGFVGKNIYTKDIVNEIKNGNLKFSMSNPTQTNTGATAYLGLLSTLAGNPEVLKESHLNNDEIKQELISLFSGLERSSGSEEFLEEMFLNGSYEAVVTYESSIININKKLESQNKETLYALYPIDGVSISDSPIAYIDNANDSKKENFLKLRDYLLSSEGQKLLEKEGRRTWFGGINENADKTVFNPKWGIDTTKYIVPIKFPNTKIIQEALSLYQAELRKPVHAVFCLDYSGSMNGEGYSQLTNAMKYILTEESQKDLLQFTEKDKVTIIPFSTYVIDTWSTITGESKEELLDNILNLSPSGSTNIYDSAKDALKILEKEEQNTYNLSIILMTDGMSNMGSFEDLKQEYQINGKNIPIYSIMFGAAYGEELEEIAELTNGKVFDGKTDLLKAFKEVRGYN